MSKVPDLSNFLRRTLMSSELLVFLTGLATDPGAMSSCMQDPASAMRAAGLSEEEQAALLSRDTARIHVAITGQKPEPAAEQPPQSANAKMVADVLTSDPVVAKWLQDFLLQSMKTWGMQPGAAPAVLAESPTPPPDEHQGGKTAEDEEKKDG
jgi:hypothetical protein